MARIVYIVTRFRDEVLRKKFYSTQYFVDYCAYALNAIEADQSMDFLLGNKVLDSKEFMLIQDVIGDEKEVTIVVSPRAGVEPEERNIITLRGYDSAEALYRCLAKYFYRGVKPGFRAKMQYKSIEVGVFDSVTR